MRASAVEQMLSFAFDQGREFERMKSLLKDTTVELNETKQALAELRLAKDPSVREVQSPW